MAEAPDRLFARIDDSDANRSPPGRHRAGPRRGGRRRAGTPGAARRRRRLVRHAAMTALNRIGRADPAAWDGVVEGLASNRPPVRDGTRLALRETYEAPLVSALVRFAGSCRLCRSRHGDGLPGAVRPSPDAGRVGRPVVAAGPARLRRRRPRRGRPPSQDPRLGGHVNRDCGPPRRPGRPGPARPPGRHRERGARARPGNRRAAPAAIRRSRGGRRPAGDPHGPRIEPRPRASGPVLAVLRRPSENPASSCPL